jgi:hypothetical protein
MLGFIRNFFGGKKMADTKVKVTVSIDKLALVEAEHARLGAMIEEIKANTTMGMYYQAETQIELRAGEIYAGIILGKDGMEAHHVILLPGEIEGTWKEAHTFAEKAGGVLPSRREQALLYANLKEEFKEAWYWSGEAHVSGSVYAWCQTFDGGNQGYDDKDSECRVRAVRRVSI